jgi:hypothetical protein
MIGFNVSGVEVERAQWVFLLGDDAIGRKALFADLTRGAGKNAGRNRNWRHITW